MMNKVVLPKALIFASAIVTLCACSDHRPAPVYDLYAKSNTSNLHRAGDIKAFYTVKPGDTLFSIAWMHSVDHEALAELNKINQNRIYPGQKLRLREDFNLSVFDGDSLVAAVYTEVLNKSQPTIQRQAPRNRKGANRPSRAQHQVKVAKLSSKKDRSRARATKTSYTQSKPKYSRKTSRKSSKLNWIWPADGHILERFSTNSSANRGLDIAGKRGQPVRATAPGKVVYKGSGLRGYGNLVIIKHNDDYLSAYAHNEIVHVSENEFVKAGQRIADIGSSGAQRDKLHFEIRYKGKPVDPLNYLPQK